jgi:hypothetical protein
MICVRPPAVNPIRAEHESRAAKDEQIAARHQQLAGIWQALEAKAAKEAAIFTAVQDTRQQWEAVTETTRRIAIAADIELRRRHPGIQLEPLRPHPNEAVGIAYPEPSHSVQEDVWIQLGSNIRSWRWPACSRGGAGSLSCSNLVLVRQAAEDLFSADLVLGEVDLRWAAACLSRCQLVKRTMRSGGVVVTHVLGQYLAQVVLADDEQLTGDLAAQGADHPFADGICSGRLPRAGGNPDARCCEHGIEGIGELPCPIPDQEPD